MRTIKIVLTGGPRAGKSSIIEEIKDYVSKKSNVRLYIIPETATEISKNLVKPQNVDVGYYFQNTVFKRQLFKEDEVKDVLNYSFGDINIILCDRGIFDNKAYLNDDYEFDLLLECYKKNELELLDEYDMVLHLVSSSLKENIEYETESNKERYESKEESKKLDIKTRKAWLGSRNWNIIYPEDNFEVKVNNVKKYIDSAIDNYYVDESKYYDIEINDKFNNECKKIDIKEIFLKTNDDSSLVLVKRKYNGYSTYFIENRKYNENKVTKYNEEKITYEKYIKYLYKYDIIKEIEKEEMSFMYDGVFCLVTNYGDTLVLKTPSYVNVNNIKNITILNKINDIKEYENECWTNYIKKYKKM